LHGSFGTVVESDFTFLFQKEKLPGDDQAAETIDPKSGS
jgi:hypothetical protein